MTAVRSEPCSACPYRRDVASGVWAAHEYDKLVGYDNRTGEQPIGAFSCHATPDHLCHGWAVVSAQAGRGFESLALRLLLMPEVPMAAVPLFASHTEAAEHGKRDIVEPTEAATSAVERLLRKYPRLRKS